MGFFTFDELCICVDCPYLDDDCPDETCPIYQGFVDAAEVDHGSD